MVLRERQSLARSFVNRVVNRAETEAVDELCTAELSWHGPGEDVRGRKRFKAFLQKVRFAFPDRRMTIDDEVAQGSRIAIRWSWRATHLGDYLGFDGSGRRVTSTGMTFFRLSGRRIAEIWEHWDQVGLRQQLGERIGRGRRRPRKRRRKARRRSG